jgi:T5SS/PEP-CTERM-associated repeat protein
MRPGTVLAATRAWNGAFDVNWFTDSQWTPAGIPAASDQLTVLSGRPITDSITTVSVNNGGQLTISGPTAAVGRTDPVSSWHAPQFNVGVSGAGRVVVQNGATLVTMGTNLGGNTGSRGEVVVQGVGSRWDVGETHFYIGYNVGEGVLTLRDHATIDYFSDLDISWGSTSRGTVIVDNAFLKAGALIISDGGQGTLTVQNGGSVTTSSTFTGQYSNTVGNVIVDGATSQLNNSSTGGGYLVAGRYGAGNVRIMNGGVVHNSRDTIVSDNFGHGDVEVRGVGSRIVNDGSLRVGTLSSVGGTGEVTIGPGGQISSAKQTNLSQTSSLTFVADASGTGLISSVGQATLDGALKLDFSPGYEPPAGGLFDVITASSLVGHFSDFTCAWPAEVIYTDQHVFVRVLPDPSTAVGVMLLGGLSLRRRVREVNGC